MIASDAGVCKLGAAAIGIAAETPILRALSPDLGGNNTYDFNLDAQLALE